MVWSLVFVLIVLRIAGGYRGVAEVLRNRRQRLLLAGAAIVITMNWGTYIYGVNTHHVVETSLGYFINPLFTILLGVMVLGERLRRAAMGGGRDRLGRHRRDRRRLRPAAVDRT